MSLHTVLAMATLTLTGLPLAGSAAEKDCRHTTVH
jgi:hypothetical protein